MGVVSANTDERKLSLVDDDSFLFVDAAGFSVSREAGEEATSSGSARNASCFGGEGISFPNSSVSILTLFENEAVEGKSEGGVVALAGAGVASISLASSLSWGGATSSRAVGLAGASSVLVGLEFMVGVVAR